MSFKDHFSGHAAEYARHRPTYPGALYAWLAAQAPGHSSAWDAGTGNGQVAVALTAWFDEVVATDASAEQIGNAVRHERVRYGVSPAESSGLPGESVDVITVAQALHWFDIPAFFDEARRVLRPGGVVAAWRYALMHVGTEIDAVIERYYADVVGPYWPPERRLVERGYDALKMPLSEVRAPEFVMETEWTLADLLGYLGTWSATRRYMQALGADPLSIVHGSLTAAWGDPERPRKVRFPLGLRAGRKE